MIGNPNALVTQNLMTARWHLCLYCYNFEDIEYILKVSVIGMGSLKAIQQFVRINVHKKRTDIYLLSRKLVKTTLSCTTCEKKSTNTSITEAATGGVLKKSLFWKFYQYSQKNTCFGVSISLQACNFIEKRHQYGCFSVNIAKFLRTTF